MPALCSRAVLDVAALMNLDWAEGYTHLWVHQMKLFVKITFSINCRMMSLDDVNVLIGYPLTFNWWLNLGCFPAQKVYIRLAFVHLDFAAFLCFCFGGSNGFRYDAPWWQISSTCCRMCHWGSFFFPLQHCGTGHTKWKPQTLQHPGSGAFTVLLIAWPKKATGSLYWSKKEKKRAHTLCARADKSELSCGIRAAQIDKLKGEGRGKKALVWSKRVSVRWLLKVGEAVTFISIIIGFLVYACSPTETPSAPMWRGNHSLDLTVSLPTKHRWGAS